LVKPGDKPEGLFRVLRWDARGSMHWAEELRRRGIPANFNADEKQLDRDSGLVREIAAMGFELGGSYDEAPFWNESYDSQYEKMARLKDKLEAVSGKPMRSFSSKYSAYNEDTLKIAGKLGIRYLFARGTAGARAVVYKPKEYPLHIISTSDVPLKDVGGGTLADGSIWSRGGTPGDFREILFRIKEDRITLVAQAQLSGVKLHWWNVYQEFFDTRPVDWKTLDEFSLHSTALPNTQIPVNTEVQYGKPQPRIPLEEEVDFPFQ
jgi:peptidoglycan/xylan/chitin deacetylase (PgdA/CDA1 family)